MGAGVRPEPFFKRPQQDATAAAEMWDRLVQSGRSPESATRIVAARFGPPPQTTAAVGASREWGAAGPSPVRAPSMLEGISRAAVQGATFGFGDEISAAIAAPFSDASYREIVQDERESDNMFRQAHPGIALGADVAGGFASGLGAGKAIAASPRAAAALVQARRAGQGSRLARAGKVLAAGAATGAAAGAGTAEEGQRLEGAASGAAFGAGAAGVLGGAGKVVHAVTKPFHPIAKQGTLKGRAVQALGGETVEDAAKGDVLKQLQRGRVTLDEFQERAANALPQETTIDIGGSQMVERAGGAVATPSRGSADIVSALEARQKGLGKAVRARVGEAMGVGRENQVQLADELVEQRRLNAGPLYDKAFDGAVVEDPDVLTIFQDPAFQKAYEVARRLARRDGHDLPESLLSTEQMGGQTITTLNPVPLRAFQYMKDALGDVIERGVDGQSTVGRNEARQLTGLLDRALTRIDEQFPDYATARAQYRGDSELINAREQGQRFFSDMSDEISAAVPKLSDAGKIRYRQGALAAIDERLAGRVNDATTPVRSDLMADKFRAVLPSPESADGLAGDLERFHLMSQNANDVLRNSKSASRLLQQQDGLGPSAADVATGFLSGNPIAALGQSAVVQAARQRMQGLTESQVDALAPYLTRMGPEQLTALVQELRAYEATRGVTLTPAQVARHAAARIAAGRMANQQ